MARGARAVPPTPTAVVNRFDTCALFLDERFFSEAGPIASMAVVNAARAGPGFAHESLVNSRGAAGVTEEERVAAGVEARRALQALQIFCGAVGPPGGGGGAFKWRGGGWACFWPPLANVHGEAISARVLFEAIYKRAASDITAASSPSEAQRIAAGLDSCGVLFVCCPDGETSRHWRGYFSRVLCRGTAASPLCRPPHTHHCGAWGERVLAASEWVHLNSCACLGGNVFRTTPCGIPSPMQSTSTERRRWYGGALGCPRGSLEGGHHVHGRRVKKNISGWRFYREHGLGNHPAPAW
jgi:hypothetical protein